MLHRDGWIHADSPEPSIAGGARSYVCDLWKPVSYFAALVLLRSLFQKGVTRVKHDWQDDVYRCLIQLNGKAFENALARIDAEDFGRLRELLRGVVALEDEDEDGPPTVFWLLGALDEAPAAIEYGDVSILPTLVEPILWTRVVAHVGEGSHRLRIYFDHLSHGSTQRAFCDCSHHGCIWCRNVCHEDKRRFCAFLYAWEVAGASADLVSKPIHLSYDPLDADVLAVLANLVLEDF